MYSAGDVSAGLLALLDQQEAPSDGNSSAPRVLAVGTSEAIWAPLREMLEEADWRVYRAQGFREAQEFLGSGGFPVVITEHHLPDGDWRDLHYACAGMEGAPAVVVTARHADDRLWAEVLSLGGHDLLVQPFQKEEVIRVCWSAWREFIARKMGSGWAVGTA